MLELRCWFLPSCICGELRLAVLEAPSQADIGQKLQGGGTLLLPSQAPQQGSQRPPNVQGRGGARRTQPRLREFLSKAAGGWLGVLS